MTGSVYLVFASRVHKGRQKKIEKGAVVLNSAVASGGQIMNRPKLALSTALVQDNVPALIPGVNKVVKPVSFRILNTFINSPVFLHFFGVMFQLYIGSIHAAFNIDALKEVGPFRCKLLPSCNAAIFA